MNTTTDTFKEERWQEILTILSEHGRIRVGHLAERLNVSEATVRRDLEAMQAQGMVLRTHGGAMLPRPTAFEVSFDESQTRALAEKCAIGRRAAALVQEGESIIIESGSTTLEMARCLVGTMSKLTVLTNSLAICMELSANEGIELIVLGGSLRRQSASLVGPWVTEFLRGARVDKAFLGANGISVPFGLSSPNVFTAETRKAMIEAARTSIALADHSKLGVEALYRVAPLDALDTLVTDVHAPREQLDPIRDVGIEVLVAE